MKTNTDYADTFLKYYRARLETDISKAIQQFETGGSVLDLLLEELKSEGRFVVDAIKAAAQSEPDMTIVQLLQSLAYNLRPKVSLLKAFINNETMSGHTTLANKAVDVKTRLYLMLLELESANGDAKALLKAVGPSGLTPFIREVEGLIAESKKLRMIDVFGLKA